MSKQGSKQVKAYLEGATAEAQLAVANGVVIGPFPLDKGMMYDHDDVAMESLGMDCEYAFAGASVQRQERPFSPGNIPVVLPRLLSPRVRTPTSTCAP